MLAGKREPTPEESLSKSRRQARTRELGDGLDKCKRGHLLGTGSSLVENDVTGFRPSDTRRSGNVANAFAFASFSIRV